MSRWTDRQLIGRLPTSPWTLDLLYATGRRRFNGAWPPGAPPALSSLAPAVVRTSDVAVIVASGPSAAVLADVPGIDAALDLFVLNHASALPVQGRLYSIEDPVLKGRQRNMGRDDAVDLLAWSLARGLALSSQAPVVVRGAWDEPATRALVERGQQLGANVILAPRFALPVHGAAGPDHYADWVRRRQPFTWPEGTKPVLSPRGGLGFFIALCIALGYPTIALIGVDMYSDEYFFDTWEGDPELEDLRGKLLPASSSPHPTAIATGRRPSMASLAIALDQRYLRPAGRRLVVGSERSALYPSLQSVDLTRLS